MFLLTFHSNQSNGIDLLYDLMVIYAVKCPSSVTCLYKLHNTFMIVCLLYLYLFQCRVCFPKAVPVNYEGTSIMTMATCPNGLELNMPIVSRDRLSTVSSNLAGYVNTQQESSEETKA